MSTKMKAPEGVAYTQVEGGMEYTPDAKGHITVGNPAHVSVLQRHGYVTVPDSLTEDEEDEFNGMTKAELIDWLEEHDVVLEDRRYSKPELVVLAEKATVAAKAGS
jgi:hypothetical protein